MLWRQDKLMMESQRDSRETGWQRRRWAINKDNGEYRDGKIAKIRTANGRKDMIWASEHVMESLAAYSHASPDNHFFCCSFYHYYYFVKRRRRDRKWTRWTSELSVKLWVKTDVFIYWFTTNRMHTSAETHVLHCSILHVRSAFIHTCTHTAMHAWPQHTCRCTGGYHMYVHACVYEP